MDHRGHEISEIGNDNAKTSYTNNNVEDIPMDNTSSTQSHYSRIIRRRRINREIRKRTNSLFPYRRLPVQVTNYPFGNLIFNGSPTFH
ncbi:hypothetical protein RclHR1_04150008 [Rhizophagus clarus]|uniref:Uncharacterized protein n=1 Tax=Rhizophagus clarus TaxID=94130 RepID=A0A2Z6RGY6_9GLOM|nr:hypothetical protein RclHR1_04150008 [Rhizophagus clarus]GES85636.1 hypothetical protein GLOIN_2v1773984 [Rhizophagus clarus]